MRLHVAVSRSLLLQLIGMHGMATPDPIVLYVAIAIVS